MDKMDSKASELRIVAHIEVEGISLRYGLECCKTDICPSSVLKDENLDSNLDVVVVAASW